MSAASELTAGEIEFLLAFADDEHMIGQRHTQWIGVAPFLEEDLAFASIAQDELGHAAGLYELVDADIDRLALRARDCDRWRSSPPGPSARSSTTAATPAPSSMASGPTRTLAAVWTRR
jgi:hypothetical protein